MIEAAKEEYNIRIKNQILDTIHGHIGLTEVEDEIEQLPIFKRLLSISQLGLINRIFPGAVHNRYSHSLGVMYVCDLMLLNINNQYKDGFFTITERQILRLAGLLHDIGHYPLSHNIEAAYRLHEGREFMDNDIVANLAKEITGCPKELRGENNTYKNYLDDYMGSGQKARFHHEKIGHDIITHNESIHNCIKNHFILIDGKLNPAFCEDGKEQYTDEEIETITNSVLRTIANIVVGAYDYSDSDKYCPHYTAMVQLMHSELDADKIDYLLRDATFSGTTYGVMDFNLLVKQLRVATFLCPDNSERYIVGIDAKGVGNVEQFLINRFLSYKQIVHSKYVTILEAMAYTIADTFISSEGSKYYFKKILEYAESKETSPDYLSFTDNYVLSFFNDQLDSTSPNKEILKSLKSYRAFSVATNNNERKESICIDICKAKRIEMMQKDDLFKDFEKVFEKLGSKCYKNLTSDERTKLLSYRFESFSLTDQIPREDFKLTRKENYVNSDFFRLANGIPIITTGQYTHNGGINDIDTLPELVVDAQSSFLHNIYGLGYYILREYVIA